MVVLLPMAHDDQQRFDEAFQRLAWDFVLQLRLGDEQALVSLEGVEDHLTSFLAVVGDEQIDKGRDAGLDDVVFLHQQLLLHFKGIKIIIISTYFGPSRIHQTHMWNNFCSRERRACPTAARWPCSSPICPQTPDCRSRPSRPGRCFWCRLMSSWIDPEVPAERRTARESSGTKRKKNKINFTIEHFIIEHPPAMESNLHRGWALKSRDTIYKTPPNLLPSDSISHPNLRSFCYNLIEDCSSMLSFDLVAHCCWLKFFLYFRYQSLVEHFYNSKIFTIKMFISS